MGNKKGNWLMSAAFVVISTVIGLLMAEVIVRIYFDHPIQPRHVIDSGYGIRANEKNVDTTHYMPGEYRISITTNNAGMRGSKNYSVQKPANIRRIALLGDSYIFGFGAEDSEVVSARLEEVLNAGADPGGVQYEVLNFSVSGFGQAELLVTYREFVRKYSPDDVVVFYFDNDIGNNIVSSLFDVDDNGVVHRTNKDFLPAVRAREILYGNPVTYWLFTNSQAWNLLRNRLSAIVQKSLLKEKGLKKFQDLSDEAVTLTKALLVQFMVDIRSDGAKPYLFVIPDRRELKSNLPLSKTELEELSVSVIDGRNFYQKEHYYVKDSHWRPIGHDIAARELAKRINRPPAASR